MTMLDVWVLLCTVPSNQVGEDLARRLVEQRLAACVNLMPGIQSVYFWEGKVQQNAETLLLIKTQKTRVDALIQWMTDHHPYDVPEVIAFPVAKGHAGYLSWVRASTS